MFFIIHTSLPSKQFGGVTVKTCQDLSGNSCSRSPTLGHLLVTTGDAVGPPHRCGKWTTRSSWNSFVRRGNCGRELEQSARSSCIWWQSHDAARLQDSMLRYKVLGGLGRFGHVFILSKGFWCCPLQTICVNDSAAKFGTAQQTRASSWRQRFVRSHPLCQELLWLWRHHRLSLPLHLGGSTFGHHNPSKNILVTCLQSSCERGLVLFDLLANPD